GWRPADYVPTKRDFVAAEMLKIEFLRGPRGYAAFFAGSLLARWANEFADVSSIVGGPAPDALWPGTLRRLMIEGERGPWVYDPSLTKAEVQSLIGAYELTGEFTPNLHPCIKSWWPSPHIWTANFSAPGMWGMAAENWL
ncbi:hypothetical protein BDZ89DRAFT_911689, partial [Hymenopellis radicata]